MEIEETLIKKKELQSLLLAFVENDDDFEHFEELTKFFSGFNISDNKQELQDLIYLILNITNNHRREPLFFDKIIQIFKYFQSSIQTFFTSLDIYNIFNQNNLMILHLIQNKIIIPDEFLIAQILKNNISRSLKEKLPKSYFLYFSIKSYINTDTQTRIESEITKRYQIDLNTFQENCEKGENDSNICKLIREDLIEDFIVYVNKTNYKLNSQINESIFETNNFLINNRPNLIEYTAFYGSIQIFKYLQLNHVEITPSIWKYAIHGRNAELIHCIEEIEFDYDNYFRNKFDDSKKEKQFNDFFDESVKCHHNAIAHYINDNYLIEENKKTDLYSSCIQYYNYEFLPTNYKLLIKMLMFKDISNSLFSLPKITIPSYETEVNDFKLNLFKILKQVVMPSSVTSIGNNYFFECSSLTQIAIPSSVTSIGNNAFYKCSSLIEISLSSSIKSIGESAFFGCTKLKEISIPQFLTSIKNSTFEGCSSLIKVIVPSFVTSIGENSFKECSSLTTIIIPSSVTSIGNYAFSKCSSLSQITIPSSVTEIGDGLFFRCSSLKQIEIPSSITEIRSSNFFECSSLTQVIIPSSVTVIGNYVFYMCSSLKEILIPSSVKSIGTGAFSGCSSLTQFTILSSVINIGECAFDGCENILCFYEKYDKFSIYEKTTKCLLISKSFVNQITFKFNEEIELILFSSSVKSIEKDAFSGCSSLREISIPSSVKSIEDSTFNECSSLVNIIIPDSVTSIGKYAFHKCSSIKTIIIPPSVTKIDENAFEKCSSLKEISLPSSLTEIRFNLFRECLSLEEITIPSSVEFIDDYAFEKCSSLKKILLPESLIEIGSYSFSGCSSLESITIPSNIEFIGELAFEKCNSLMKFTVPKKIDINGIGLSPNVNIDKVDI